MKRSDQLKAAAVSAMRVFMAASLAAYLALGKSPEDLALEDLKSLAGAGVAALALTAVNWLRKGESRFGRGAKAVITARMKYADE